MTKAATHHITSVQRTAFGVWAGIISFMFLLFLVSMAQSPEASEFLRELRRDLYLGSPLWLSGLLCAWIGTHLGARRGHPYVGGALALPAWLCLMLALAMIVMATGALGPA